MNSTLNYLRGCRRWFVSGLTVYGQEGSAEIPIALSEAQNPGRVMFALPQIGSRWQSIRFSELTDVFGEPLPEIIAAPAVIIIQRSKPVVYLADRPNESGFQLYRDSQTVGEAIVDLLIMENERL